MKNKGSPTKILLKMWYFNIILHYIILISVAYFLTEGNSVKEIQKLQ